MEQNSIKLRFGGESHQISTNTLIAELTHITTVINQVNNELGSGAREIQINVNALEKGYFIVDLSVVESIFRTIFSKDSVEYAAALVTVVPVVYKVFQKLKGRPAKEEDIDTIRDVMISSNNEVLSRNNITINNIYNIYNKQVIRQAISDSVRAADEDGNIDSINIVGGNDVKTTFEKDEFKDLSYDDFSSEKPQNGTEDEDVFAVLTIKQLHFEKGNTWKFNWEGREIKMKVSDGALMEQINNRTPFAKGDKIRVKMRIHRVWNDDICCMEDKKYSIIEFFEIIHPPKQQNIELN